MVKNYFLNLFLLFSISLSSQIKITEIYHDTPYNERMTLFNGTTQQEENARRHHWGEFIEIYNYSDRDISLENWYIKDRWGIFWLPSDKTIKKGDFMVIAYSAPTVNTTPFTELFSTTQGKDDQIIKQNNIILNSYKESVSLGYSFGRQVPTDKGGYSWNLPKTSNRVIAAYTQPGVCYSVNSFQLVSNGSYSLASPNPLDAIYKPPTVHFEDIMLNDYLANYVYLDWSDNVLNLINNTCPISIQKIQQIPSGTYNSGSKCFNYDLAGSNTDSYDCTPSNGTTTPSTDYTYDELQTIKNSIKVYPNPVNAANQYTVTITWDGPAFNKIYNLQVYNAGGGYVFGYMPTNGINYTSFSLQNQLTGIFVVNFTLNTGQVVSKNILKW
ncbi:lamin tail domain-containing protein [Epilithonimonas pallida]|uniref:Lamin Tail Domain n=1 Tax=Epilithonimonas pallida TaxID=373671 RepID=A0ABY1R3H1_9FLAO|nr:lamin tail domain-containing protein [Epilithonimonas pallida]SMP90537.1 Lamin Tail Domain [Epilithonimonas pallida]